jgi:hypothetical protein
MDQSRSSSVPLIHIDDLHDDEDIEHGYLPRNSFSMSSIQQPILSRPGSPLLWHNNTTKVQLDEEDDTDVETIEEDDEDSSSISESSEDETSIAIPGRKALVSSQVHQQNSPILDLSSDILYEDIWIDSPVFHEYLQSLETWLYHYLTWLEKVEQCRQLEIGNIRYKCGSWAQFWLIQSMCMHNSL